ncbi:MAG: hypothetical protein H0W76_04115 [Pyrinomonadaceae bacterium]|nr:hypothetical protein [Pyrinomonadaceae bacterium]
MEEAHTRIASLFAHLHSAIAQHCPVTCHHLPVTTEVVSEDHLCSIRGIRAICFKTFHTAERTLEGVEAMNMMRKGQVERLGGSDAQGQAKFVASLFQIAA